MEKINDLIVKSAEVALNIQRQDGSFEPGYNGPWNDKETPARVTSNWILTLLKAHDLTERHEYLTAARSAGDFLIGLVVWPFGYSFYCRRSNIKNKCNGLIGQAWVLDALSELGGKYLKIAEMVILKHQFNTKQKLWHTLGIEGTDLGINWTLNQQIWFSAVAFKVAKLTENEELEERARLFFSNLPNQIRFNGRYINHLIHPLANLFYQKQSRGYLSFTLAGLAYAFKLSPSLINKEVAQLIEPAIQYADSKIFYYDCKFCWSYNPTGFEIPFVLQTFRLNSTHTKQQWIQKQLSNFNFETNLMTKNTADPNTLASRIYEATWLNNYTLQSNKSI